MNQKKIGRFLKELRKEMGITQEEFAEKLDVSSRTISRWETGANMPDISLLVNIAEIFNVSIPEIINGERKSEIMEKETKKVAEAMSDYATAEKAVVLKRVKVITKTSHTSNGNCSLKIQQYRQSDNKLSPCSRSG